MLDNAQCLSDNERAALVEIKRRVSALFDVRRYILFGSKARGEATPDSDVDLLMITGRQLPHRDRHVISRLITEVNLEYDTLFSFIAVDQSEWNSKLYSYLPIHGNVEREGIEV